MERKNIEEFLEIILIVHAQRSLFRSDKFKDCSSEDTFRILPGYTCFLEWNCFQDLCSDVLPFPSAPATLPPLPLFLPQNSRDIRVTSHGSLTGALPLKPLPRPFTRFLLLSHSSIYSYSFSDLSLPDFDGNETSFQWHLLFVDRAKNSLPIFPIILPCEIAKPIRFVILNMCF